MGNRQYIEVNLFTIFVSIPVTLWMVCTGRVPTEIFWLFLLWGTKLPMKWHFRR